MSTVIEPHEPGVAGSGFASVGGPGPVAQQPATQSAGTGRGRFESLAIFVVFGTIYGVLGYWLVVHQHVFTFASLDRLGNAYLAWHGKPPKLAAVGFSMPPVVGVVLLPFTIITSMAKSLVALPIVSAIFGGLTMVAMNRLMERCDMPPLLRYPVLILTAAVPTLVFYSAAGGAEMISLWLLAVAISALIAWFRTVDTRYLISSGMAFGLASMADYTNFVWMLVAATMVATVLARHGADDAEVEGSVITYVAPALYVLVLWILVNWLIVKSPFGWVHDVSSVPVNVVVGHTAAHSASVVQAFGDSLRLALNAAPLSLIIAPALILCAVVQRNELAGWLAAFTIIAIFRPGGEAILHGNIADLQMSLSPPQLLMALAGSAWLYQSFPDVRPIIGGLLLLGMIATIVVVWHGMNVYPYQDGEQAFHKAIAHSSVKPTSSLAYKEIGDGQEVAMADYINQHVHKDLSILADNSQTYGVILKTGNAALFQTRLDNGGSGAFPSAVKSPPKSVKYLLIAYNDAADQIHIDYPNAVTTSNGQLSVVFKDKRYALVSVKPGTTDKNYATGPIRPKATSGLIPLNNF
jgi:hypothetical protein